MIVGKGFYAISKEGDLQCGKCDCCGTVNTITRHGEKWYCKKCWLAEDLEVKETIRNIK